MKLTLQEIKSIAFDILMHFKQFCEKNGISYFLSNGTLLGAVKYKGFIPWDDDVDVLVPREDYNRLLELYQDSKQYKLYSSERDPAFRYTFAKLCDRTTVKEESNIDNGVKLGIDIDIFPLDRCSEHIYKPRILKTIRKYQIGCILSKFTSSKGKSLYKRCIIHYCRMRGYDYFHHALVSLINREVAVGGEYKGCLMWPIYGKREILPADIFSETVEVEFEGERFPAPVGYDRYLRSLYSDYEQDLPLDKQKTHHKFRAYLID